MRKLLVILFGTLFPVFGLLAQVSGYQGRRAILKSDLMSPLLEGGYSGQFEFSLLRNIAVYVDYRHQNRQFEQKITPYFDLHGAYPAEKGRIRTDLLSFGARWFFGRAIPAPKGVYNYLQFGLGRAQVDGTYYVQTGTVPNITEQQYPFTVSNARVTLTELGAGYQEILWGRLVVDGSLGLAIGTLNAQEHASLVTYLDQEFGPNLVSVFGNKIGVGFGGHVMIGILIF